MKFSYLIPVFALLSGCMPERNPCMDPTEKGTIVRAESRTEEFCSRGGCTQYTIAYINVNVGGVMRTCIVKDAASFMFKPGDVVNFQTGHRL